MSAADDFLKQYGGAPAAAPAEDLPDDIPDMDSDYRAKHKRARIYYPLVDRFAKEYPDVPELSSYAKAMMLRESGGNPEATSGAGARGLMQVMPPTYQEMGGDPENATDPVDNVQRGLKYIAQQYRDFGNWDEALAAYNWGPGNVARNGLDNLPHETSNYLKAVNGYKKRLKPTAVEQMLNGEVNALNEPNMAQGENAQSFLTAYMGDKPSLDTFQPPGRIDINQPQPVANGLPALQSPQMVAGPAEPPPEQTQPIPFTNAAPPQMAGFQPPPKPSAQENLQAAEDRRPVDVNEFGQGVIKGMAQGATAGLYKPNVPARQAPAAEMGQLMGGMAPMALAPLGGAAAAAGMAGQAFLQHAKPDASVQQNQGIENPIETVVQTTLASVLGSVGPGAMPNMAARIGAGAGIGGAQAVAGQITQKIAQLANEGQVDPYNQEDVKSLVISMLQGGIFGAHGGEGAAHGEATPIQHPGEMRSPLPEQKSFADKAMEESLQNTQTRFKDYDPEGKRPEPINVPPEQGQAPQPSPKAAQDMNVMKHAFLNTVAEAYGPEKADVFRKMMAANFDKLAQAGHGVGLRLADEVLPPEANADLNAKNSSSSSHQPIDLTTMNEGAGSPLTPEATANEPSGRASTWTGNPSTSQNVEGPSVRNVLSGVNDNVAMSDNVSQAPEEVKPRPFKMQDVPKRPDKIPTLKSKIHSILQGRKIYIDDEVRNQLGISKGGARELGPIFTNDKANGITLDGLAEIINEQAGNKAEFYRGIGDGRKVEMNDVVDALFAGNNEYERPTSQDLEHVPATNDFLRNGNPDIVGAKPTQARTLPAEFDAAGMKFKRIKATDKSRIAYKDEYGGKYEFSPDDVVHVGGEMKPAEPSGEKAPAINTDDEQILFQKGPPKASQEDMFGNKGRVASEGFIKGKGEDKGLEGTPLFEGEKRQEQAKAEEDQQRLFQKDEEKKPAPTFYSQLRKAIDEKMPNAAGPEAIKGLVKANAVKEEELKWSGLDDLLKTKEGQKLTKQEVLDHLDQNQVEVKEVTKETGSRSKILKELGEKHDQAMKAHEKFLNEGFEKYGQGSSRVDWPPEARAEDARLDRATNTAEDAYDRVYRGGDEANGEPKFKQYQEPGGKNYREMLLTLPDRKSEAHAKRLKAHSDKMTAAWDAKDHDLYRQLDNEYSAMHAPGKDPSFKSSHWNEPNVLAHVRFNDRTTPDGKKVLHLEEVQSDWHQKGRKDGYQGNRDYDVIEDPVNKGFFRVVKKGEKAYAVLDGMSGWGDKSSAEEAAKKIDANTGSRVPDAPFKKTWHEMALRRMLRYAAENGYDYLSWTGGEKQAERYDLSRHIDRIMYSKEDDGKYYVGAYKNNREISGLENEAMDEQRLADTFGKDIAEKITKGEGSAIPGGPEKELLGLDLKVGGDGMKGFYDKMIPSYLSKYGKKWGANTQEIKAAYEGSSIRAHDQAFQGIPITEAMRKSVLEEGQPLFQGKPENDIKGYTDYDPAQKKFTITLINGKADVSTLFHEFFHVLEQGGVVTKADRAILTKALEVNGFTDAINSKGVFKKEAAEKMADWWERYLRDGKSPVKELQGLFDKVKNWMIETYRGIHGTRLEDRVPHSVRKVFDNLIEGGREVDAATPEGQRLEQRGGKPSVPAEQMVGPDAPRNQKPATREDFMVMEAKAGEKESGYLSNPEKLLFGAADRAYPIKKIQKLYEKEFGFPVSSDQDLNYAINRIYGAAGTADQYIDKHLAPAIEGGKIGSETYERLQPAESKKLFEYLLARDALWRYENTDGYQMPNNLSKKMAEGIVREHKGLAAKNPEQFAKLEKAGDAMIEYARSLAIKKVEMGLWTPEEYKEITQNPVYIPEIRYWAKTLATGKSGGQGLDFATKSKLVRGTQATSENVPVFDPLTSLIHDTHQLAKEGAKHYLGNAIIDMQESSPELQKIITEQEPDYKPKAHEGTFPVRRPRTTHLSPEQEKFAERYQDAVYRLEMEEETTGTSREDIALGHERRRIKERIQALPARKRALLAPDMLDIIKGVEESRQKWKDKRLKEARETEAEFKALPAEQQKLIKRWMKEGLVTNYTVPIELAQAMNAMNPIEYGTLGKLMKGATTIFKKGTVTWNPGFAFINGIRDVQEAYINTGMPPHYALKGFSDFLKQSDLYHQYMERGGAIGSGESGFKGSTTRSGDLRYGRGLVKDRFNKVKDPEAWKKQTIKVGDKEIKVGQLARMAEAAKEGVTLPFEAMEAFGHMSEMSTRLGIMRYAMEKLGKNVDQAVDMARHGTLDFDQRGASLNVQRAMDVVPFLNPKIQGTLRTGKRLMDGRKAAQTMVIGGLAPMLGLTALNMMNPNYANVSDREKRYSWIIMLPGTDKQITIPKPAPVQTLLNPFQMALERAVGTTPTSLRQQAIDDMQEILPVSDPSSILPPLAKVVIENKINKDIYWDRPIVKEPGREAVDQYDPRTTATMKKLAAKLHWLPKEVEWLKSPERLQHLSKTILGGTGDNLLFVSDLIFGDAKKTLRSDYVPVVSRFYKGAEDWQGELANQQRELISEIKLKKRAAASSTEAQQLARKGEILDPKAMAGRLNRSARAIEDDLRKLGEVNKEIARVNDLIEAVKANNPNVKYRVLRPPVLKGSASAPPAPSDTIPEDEP